jgi:hypothetical protein
LLNNSAHGDDRHHVPVIRVASLLLVLLASAVLASSAASTPTALPGLMTSKVPWPANNGASLKARLKAILARSR